MKMHRIFPIWLVFTLALIAAAPARAGQGAVGYEPELGDIAEDAYIYAYPMVLMRITRDVGTNVPEPNQFKAPVNQFSHMRDIPTPDFTAVVRPNADTLYSTMFYDVSKEPLVIEIPDAKAIGRKGEPRYCLFPLLDFWTNVFASPGTRTTGPGAQTFAIVGPDWRKPLPPGVREYRSPTASGWVIGRTETAGEEADLKVVHAFQDGIAVRPLSSYGQPYTPPPHEVDPRIDMTTPPVDQVERMTGEEFFTLFAEALKTNPPQAVDYPMLDRMRCIGIEPGQSLVFSALPKVVREALEKAPKPALARIKRMFETGGTLVNGWRVNLTGIGTYGADYAHRAGVAYAGLGANVIEDAVYPTAMTEADGKTRFSSGKRYVIHFDAGDLPPVRGFWSLTLYNDRQLFAANEVNRYAIGDRDPLCFDPDDGSLDLYIQRDMPDAARQANWLPAPPSGGFTLNLRLYWPKSNVLDGSWAPPAVKWTEQ